MIPLGSSRRSFLKTAVALAGTTPLMPGLLQAQTGKAGGPLLAYVGTFSSPLGDVLPTQVDLPPGNGRGISTSTPTAAGCTPFRKKVRRSCGSTTTPTPVG